MGSGGGGAWGRPGLFWSQTDMFRFEMSRVGSVTVKGREREGERGREGERERGRRRQRGRREEEASKRGGKTFTSSHY